MGPQGSQEGHEEHIPRAGLQLPGEAYRCLCHQTFLTVTGASENKLERLYLASFSGQSKDNLKSNSQHFIFFIAYEGPNKLECLSQESLFGLFLYNSLACWACS
jgi:hypothetical protein